MIIKDRIVMPRVIGGLFVALLLTLLPFSRVLSALMPQWVMLFVLYWVVVLPERFGVIFALFSGLLLDCVTGTLLGQHAFALVFVAYCALKLNVPLRSLPMWQQVIMVGVFSLVSLLLQYFIMQIAGQVIFVHSVWLSCVTSMMVWPVITTFLRPVNYQSRL